VKKVIALVVFSFFPFVSLSLRTSAQTLKPKLVVGIVIDQFRYDYLERFSDLFGEDGFQRLVREGAVFSDAQYLHAVTVTAPGHAAFMTGSIPSLNGIIGNEWFDRAEGKEVTSVSDDAVRQIGSAGGEGASPHRLIGSTLGDELKLSSGGASHVIGISMKDRAAIMPAGHHPDGVFWFDDKTGLFVSSTYYMKQLPSWAVQFDARHPADAYFGKTWSKLRPESDYLRSGVDDSPYERPERGRRVFPYTINGGGTKPSQAFYDDLLDSPFSNDLLLAFAKDAIEGENLGMHEATDLLTISFSCNDVIGHNYGPYSHEVEDVTLRTDKILNDLFHYLDERFGRDGYLIAFTADHGVGPSPEQAIELKLGGGRFTWQQAEDFISKELVKRFGEEKWILSYQSDSVYLNWDAAGRRNVSIPELARETAKAALMLPEFRIALTEEDLRMGRVPPDAISQRILRSYFPGRSGDVFIVPKPYYGAVDRTATHGSPYSYDTNVPVILWGKNFAPGHYATSASPADIAPTLASVLHVTRPSVSIGRVLTEALR
jgi:predicted AlkP superfamily pyrophosphatase or phosphodiesterase